jgi:uncharacterized protein (DUF433 family)
MIFDEYLDLTDPDGPKLVGHRIWLDQLLYEVVHHRRDADQLIERFPTLDRPTVYACILYFEQHRTECLTRLYADIARKEENLANARARNEAQKAVLLERAGLIVSFAFGFLLDEHIHPALHSYLRLQALELHVQMIGDGIFSIDLSMSVAQLGEHLIFVAQVSFPNEYQNAIWFLPIL